ncbi:MAG: recombinase RecA [Ruminococcus sp.]|nr:recombinase RecA [Ruminococcus sp.]MDE7098233.1 recombinase RecA [Ruminococcus sp.]
MAKKELAKKTAVVKVSAQEDKKSALESAIKVIEKKYGAGAVMRLGQTKTLNVASIPTGSMTLDMALGIGGVPRGRIVEIYGPESSGKTTVALSIIAQAQKQGGEAAFIDVEHALDPKYAKDLGVNIDNLLVSQPDSGEQALEIAEALIRSGAIDVIVLDSIAAMTTRAEIDGEMGDLHVGQLARLMSQAMRKLTAAISKSSCVAIFINQVREKIGVMYGNPETTPGGRALKFYSSVRIEVRRGEVIKDGTQIIGASTRCKVVKNKVAPPFKEAEFDLMYGTGISRTGEVLDIAIDLGIIEKGGSWFKYKGENIGQGRDKVKDLLQSNPDFMKEVEEQILSHKDEIEAEKSAKKAVKSKASAIASEIAESDVDSVDEDFEEFTPAD